MREMSERDNLSLSAENLLPGQVQIKIVNQRLVTVLLLTYLHALRV